MTETQVLDLEHLSMMTGGDASLAVEVLGIFRSQAEMWGRLLDPSVDCAHWADACHTIKGASRGIGAMPLGDACERGETRGRAGEVSLTEAAVLLSDVKDWLNKTLEALAHAEHSLAQSVEFTSSGAS